MKKAAAWIVAALVVSAPMLPLFVGGGPYAQQRAMVICAAVAAAALLVFSALGAVRPDRQKMRFSVCDLAVAAYLAYGLLNALAVSRLDFDPVFPVRWFAVAACYVLARVAGALMTVLGAVALCGLLQSFVAAGQLAAIFASRHSLFDVTGTFGNPGPLGGYLAVALVACAAWAWAHKGLKRGVFAAAAGVIAAMLVVADSRASWVAAAAGLVFLFARQLRPFSRRAQTAAWIGTVVVTVVAAVMLYGYRPASARARLLVWRVTTGMVAEKPLTGVGAGRFPQEYMLRQADHFRAHPDSPDALVANNIAYPYNEPLHVAAEQGVPGLLLLATLAVALLRRAGKTPAARGVAGAAATWLVFSLFSYPADVFPMLLLLAVLAGSARNEPTGIPVRRWMAAAVVLLCAGGLWLSVRVWGDASRTSEFLTRMIFNDEADPAQAREHYRRLRYDHAFSFAYAQWLASRKEVTPDDVPPPGDVLPNTDMYCFMGQAARHAGLFPLAEHYFIRASEMVPSLLRPDYLLFGMYRSQGDTLRAAQMAQRMLTRPLKVENTFTLRAKAEAREFSAKHKDQSEEPTH